MLLTIAFVCYFLDEKLIGDMVNAAVLVVGSSVSSVIEPEVVNFLSLSWVKFMLNIFVNVFKNIVNNLLTG